MPATLSKGIASLTVLMLSTTEEEHNSRRNSKAEEPGLKPLIQHDVNKILGLPYLIWGYHGKETFFK